MAGRIHQPFAVRRVYRGPFVAAMSDLCRVASVQPHSPDIALARGAGTPDDETPVGRNLRIKMLAAVYRELFRSRSVRSHNPDLRRFSRHGAIDDSAVVRPRETAHAVFAARPGSD